jgi:hypothetical protein
MRALFLCVTMVMLTTAMAVARVSDDWEDLAFPPTRHTREGGHPWTSTTGVRTKVVSTPDDAFPAFPFEQPIFQVKYEAPPVGPNPNFWQAVRDRKRELREADARLGRELRKLIRLIQEEEEA